MGAHENYQDRNTFELVGTSEAEVSDLHYPYIRPHKNECKTDRHWIKFTNF
ncbi:hypothetical protein AB1A65_13985 [Muricauda sp. ANG21]|uniref:hypothetical protein n=1 Tax=Allomuricauda sp. ANG21 TaxID=3042468 RepID=UPI0034549560